MTTMEAKSIFKTSGAPTARSMAKSVAIHVFVLSRADAHTGASAVSQRAPQQRTRHRLLSSTGDRGQRREPFRVRYREGRMRPGHPPGAPAPALKPKPNAPAGPDLAGKSGTPTRSGGGRTSGAKAEGGKHRHPGIQGQVREPGARTPSWCLSEPMRVTLPPMR